MKLRNMKLRDEKLEKGIGNELKLDLKLTNENLDLRTMDTNIVLSYLDNQLKVREITATEKLKRYLKQKVYK